MSSNWIQAARNVKDSAAKHGKLLAACAVWCFICTWQGISGSWELFLWNGQSASSADLVIAQQLSTKSGLMIVPVFLLFVIKCKQDSLNTQYILRYRTRGRMFLRQLLESLFYSVGMALFLTITGTIIGTAGSGRMINWNEKASVYYAETGHLSSAGYLMVISLIWLMYVIKFMALLVIIDILLWYPKGLFLIWAIFLIPLGIEARHLGRVFFELFAVWQAQWESTWTYAALTAAGCALIAIEAVAGGWLIRKRDIFN